MHILHDISRVKLSKEEVEGNYCFIINEISEWSATKSEIIRSILQSARKVITRARVHCVLQASAISNNYSPKWR